MYNIQIPLERVMARLLIKHIGLLLGDKMVAIKLVEAQCRVHGDMKQ